jgi:hypothetical protein
MAHHYFLSFTRLLPLAYIWLLLGGCKKEPSENLGPLSTFYFYPEAGPIGATVTLLGHNFSAAPATNRVTFTSAQASGFYAKNDTLKVSVPAGATDGPLTVQVYDQHLTTPQSFLVTRSKWARKADFGAGPNVGGFGFSAGGKVYMLLPTNALWAYDQAQNRWSRQADCIAPIPDAYDTGGTIGFSIGESAYIGVINRHYPYSAINFYRYDTRTNSWSASAPLTSIYSDARWLVCFTVSGKGYVVVTDDIGDKAVREYDPQTNQWMRKGAFPGSYRFLSQGFALGNTGYLAGGTPGHSPLFTELWAYNPQTDYWTRKADLVESTENVQFFTIGQRAYVAFGTSAHRLIRSYDSATNTWSREADYLGPAFDQGVCLSLGTKGYIVGGRGVGNDFHADTWEFSAE